MYNRYLIFALSALCLGLAVMPADARITSRTANFLFQCNGQNNTANFTATGLGANNSRTIVGSQLVLFENQGGLQYVILRAQGDSQKQLLTLGKADNSQTVVFPGTISANDPPVTPVAGTVGVTADGLGNVVFTIDGACNPGFGQVQGNVTIWFTTIP